MLGVSGEQLTDAPDGPADAVRTLNETRGLIAGFRDSATRCEYGLSEDRREVAASGGTFSVEIDADSSCAWTATAFGDFLSVQSDANGNGAGSVSYSVEANGGAPRVGYVVVAGETVSVYQSGAAALVSVCDRSGPVRDGIVSATGRACDLVSEFDLLDVVSLDLARQGIQNFDAGDFKGLWNLVELRLNGNRLAGIPVETFQDLVNLQSLNLVSTGLTAVPPAIRGLPSLQRLELAYNAIRDLRRDAFQGLFELRELVLHSNALVGLPDGVLADVRALSYLDLRHNQITDIRKEALEGPSELGVLILSNNPLGELREDAFTSIPRIWRVELRATQLSAIPPRTFAETEIFSLNLSENRIQDISRLVLRGNEISRLDLSK